MAIKIGIFNLTKGSGKTTTTAFLAAALTAANQKVLTVDLSGDLKSYYRVNSPMVSGVGLTWENLGSFSFDLIQQAMVDYVLVDFPSLLSNDSLEALKYMDRLIIPVEAEFYGLENLNRTFEAVSEVDKLLIEGILLCRANKNSDYQNLMRKELQNYFPNFIFDSAIMGNYYLAQNKFSLEDLNGSGFNAGLIEYLKLANEIIENER